MLPRGSSMKRAAWDDAGVVFVLLFALVTASCDRAPSGEPATPTTRSCGGLEPHSKVSRPYRPRTVLAVWSGSPIAGSW
jgi:hypothetical protein